MYPVICRLGPLTVYSYGLSLVLAFTIATLLLRRQAREQGLNPELLFNLSFVILVSGIVGARILYVILNLKTYLNKPLQILMLNQGGLAWFGGLIVASLSCMVYLSYKGLDIYKIFDLTIPYVALGQAIGRIGCFLNGCCYGLESLRFGLYFPTHDAVLIPTQLYSSLALLGIYIILRVKQLRVYPHTNLQYQHNRIQEVGVGAYRRGEIFYLYLFLYCLWRFFIEFFRADSEIFILNLSIFQIFSIILFILSIVMLIRIKRQPI